MGLTYRFCKKWWWARPSQDLQSWFGLGSLKPPSVLFSNPPHLLHLLLFPSIVFFFFFFDYFNVLVLLFLGFHDSYFCFAISMYWAVLAIIILIAVILLFLLLKKRGFHFCAFIYLSIRHYQYPFFMDLSSIWFYLFVSLSFAFE